MKRKAKGWQPRAKRIFTLSWRKCTKCGFEFRYEFMYQGLTVTLCDECAPMRDDAVKLIKELIV